MQRVPPELTFNARRLRREATPAEQRLWRALRTHRPRFTRQLVISHFIIDIACRSARIGIELDGGHHAEQPEANRARTACLADRGWTMPRFWNNEVADDLEGVVSAILLAVARAATHLQPLPCREGRCDPTARTPLPRP